MSQSISATSAFHIHPSVQNALSKNLPIVALESTIITHGMPYPSNLQNALSLIDIVQQNHAIPATIAIISGVPCIGLTKQQLHQLATDQSVVKCSKRDIPYICMNQLTAGTTVSATAFIAAKIGIKVFATGGIGAVHRDVQLTWDISQDIQALANIPILIISAGVKSILDIGKSLEALETAGVPVIVYNHHQFPAFYTTNSGYHAPYNIKNELQIAEMFQKGLHYGCTNGMLVAVPVPKLYEADAQIIEESIQKALKELNHLDIQPNQKTPYLLKRVSQLTNGESLETNMQLVKNNVKVASSIAVQLCKLQLEKDKDVNHNYDLMVIGGTALDIHCDITQNSGLSNQGIIRQDCGGVGKNIAHAATVFAKVNVCFISAVGDDDAGKIVLNMLKDCGVPTKNMIQRTGKRTGVVFVAHGKDGDLQLSVADMYDMFNDVNFSLVSSSDEVIQKGLSTAKLVVFDSNHGIEDMKEIGRLCEEARVNCWYEPTTTAKCRKILKAGILGQVWMISPNEDELYEMASFVKDSLPKRGKDGYTEEEICELSMVLLKLAREENRQQSRRVELQIICTRGSKGVLHVQLRKNGIHYEKYEAEMVNKKEIKNTTGAGDCFAGACSGMIAKGMSVEVGIRRGIEAAAACVKSEKTVPNHNKVRQDRIFKSKL